MALCTLNDITDWEYPSVTDEQWEALNRGEEVELETDAEYHARPEVMQRDRLDAEFLACKTRQESRAWMLAHGTPAELVDDLMAVGQPDVVIMQADGSAVDTEGRPVDLERGGYLEPPVAAAV